MCHPPISGFTPTQNIRFNLLRISGGEPRNPNDQVDVMLEAVELKTDLCSDHSSASEYKFAFEVFRDLKVFPYILSNMQIPCHFLSPEIKTS